MKKLIAVILTAAFFFSLSGAAHAAASQPEVLPQRSGFTFFKDEGEMKGKKRDGGKKPKPDPTPKPRKPGPRDEPESNDD